MTRDIGVDAVINKIRLKEQSSVATPPSTYGYLYIKSGGLYFKGSGGTEIGPLAAGGSITEYDYVEKTTTVSVTATTEGTSDTVITGNSVSYDGSTKICVEFFTPRARATTGAANAYMVVDLYEDSTILGHLTLLRTPATGSDDKAVLARRFVTPAAGSHTYTVKAYVSAGTGEFTPEAGGTGASLPAYLRITKA